MKLETGFPKVETKNKAIIIVAKWSLCSDNTKFS